MNRRSLIVGSLASASAGSARAEERLNILRDANSTDQKSSAPPPVQHFESLAGTRTAHLIIDLQNGFLSKGALSEVPMARELISNVNRISAATRAAGGRNVFLRFTVDNNEPFPWLSFRALVSKASYDQIAQNFQLGAEPHGLWSELEVFSDDVVMNKTRYSAFIAGTCDLQDYLLSNKIDTVIITGTLTNCCCESTARDAMQMGYCVIFVSDGTASTSATAHNGTLSNLATFSYADVRETADLLTMLRPV
jgi:nicotinamidase-related amidase